MVPFELSNLNFSDTITNICRTSIDINNFEILKKKTQYFLIFVVTLMYSDFEKKLVHVLTEQELQDHHVQLIIQPIVLDVIQVTTLTGLHVLVIFVFISELSLEIHFV